MIQLTTRDAASIYQERPAVPTPIVSGYLFELPAGTELTREAVHEWVADRIGLHPLFRRRIVRVPLDLEHPYLVEDRLVDLDQHIHVTAVDTPGWEGVRREVERLSTFNLSLDVPPWELHVLTGLGPMPGHDRDVVAVVLRFHHAACDGIASIEATRVLFGPDVTDRRQELESAPSRLCLFARAVGRLPGRALGVVPTVRDVRESTGRARSLAEQEGRSSARARPRVSFDDKLGPDRVFDAVDLALSDVQAARGALPGATVNDVMTTAIAGALADCLQQQGCPRVPGFTATVPISIRGLLDSSGQNHIRILVVDLHLDIDDPVDRLGAIHRSIRVERQYRLNEVVERSWAGLDLVPAPVFGLIGRLEDRRAGNESGPVSSPVAAITNTPQGAADMYLGPARVVSTYGALALEQGTGLSHCITTIGDVLTVSVLSTPEMLPDVTRYTEQVARTLSSLVRYAAQCS